MIGPLTVRWWPQATEDWLRLPYDAALLVSRAVHGFAKADPVAGTVVVYTEGEYRLLIGGYLVVILIDGDTLHVERVRRA